MNSKVTAIILAAGQSRRMGRQKLLLDFNGKLLIQRVVETVAESCVDKIIVVTGGHHDEVLEAVGDGVKFTHNPDPSRGMLSSVRCGLVAIDSDTQIIAVFLGDQPRLSPNIINTVIATFLKSPRLIAVPVLDGKRGHPLVFDGRYRDEVLSMFDKVGLRGLLAAHPEEVCEVEVDSKTILEDVDTEEDFQKLLEKQDDSH